MPAALPTRAASMIASSATWNDSLVASAVRAKTSRPNWSVPNQYRHDGGWRASAGCWASASYGKSRLTDASTSSASAAARQRPRIPDVERDMVRHQRVLSASARLGRNARATSVTRAHPRVDLHVEQVGGAVHEHEGDRHQQDRALHDRVLPVVD